MDATGSPIGEEPTASPDNAHSSYREVLIEHLFAGELMRHLWLNGGRRMEVLKPQVDDGGYDLVLEANDVVRHVQLKASHSMAATHHVNVSLSLQKRPSGCVIWIIFDREGLQFQKFLWFGGPPGQPLPDISGFEITKHTKANAAGVKGPRPGLRSVPRGRFEVVADVSALLTRLFGEPPPHSGLS